MVSFTSTQLVVVLSVIFGVMTMVKGFPSNSGLCAVVGDVLTQASTGMSTPTRSESVGPASRFGLSISPTQYVPGQAHTVTLTRNTGSGGFAGLLLYIEDSSSTRIGTFDTVASSTQTLPPSVTTPSGCSGYANTITHVQNAAFTAAQGFTWNAPATVNGPITIYAIAYETAPESRFNVPTPLTVTAGPTGTNAPATSGPSASPATASPQTPPPSGTPSYSPTNVPTDVPTLAPTTAPVSSAPVTGAPSQTPATSTPSSAPATANPSGAPATRSPATSGPTQAPSKNPSGSPSTSGPTTARPSVSPTHRTSLPAPCNTTTTQLGMSGVGIHVNRFLNRTLGLSLVIVSGPVDAWFAVGYGNQMVGSQAVIVRTEMSMIGAKLYDLNSKALNGSGIVALPTSNQPSGSLTAVINGTRTVCMIIPESNLTASFQESTTVDVIYAKGTSQTFGYHGQANAGVILGVPASEGTRVSLGFFAVLAVLAALVW